MDNIVIRQLGTQPYQHTYHAMHDFTKQRNNQSNDEIWLLEHPAVFTQGKVGKPKHLLGKTTIPIYQTDRGGQITYHGPGQQIMYILLDLKRLKVSVRDTVSFLEQSVISTLAFYHIDSYTKSTAPGVYVANKKICSLGLNIRHGCSLHGLALNINMDLSPFNIINPCGYAGLQMTQLNEYVDAFDREQINHLLTSSFIKQLSICNRSSN